MKEMNLQAKSKSNTKIADAANRTFKHTAASKPAAVSSKQTIKSSPAVLMPEKLDIANKFLAALTIPE